MLEKSIIVSSMTKEDAHKLWGTGLKNTYLLCNEAGIKCSYEKELEGFWFIFYRNNANNVTTNDTINVTTNDTIKMSELEMLILSEIQKDNHVTRDKLASISGRTSRTIQRALDSLKSKGIIERVGSNKTGNWKIKI